MPGGMRWHEWCSCTASPGRPPFRFGTLRQQGWASASEAGAVRGNKVSIGIMQPSLQTLYSYWNEVRAGRLAPQRLEIEPSRIAGILSETFMLERIDAGTYQFRLAGTRLCEMFGSELRGKNFLDGWSEQDRHVLERDLATIGEQGAVAVLTIEGVVDTRHRVELEANLLPLLHAGKITRIIGAMSATSAPHWLGHEPLRSRQLMRHRADLARRAAARDRCAAGPAGAVPAGADGARCAPRQDRAAAVSRARRGPRRQQARQALGRPRKVNGSGGAAAACGTPPGPGAGRLARNGRKH